MSTCDSIPSEDIYSYQDLFCLSLETEYNIAFSQDIGHSSLQITSPSTHRNQYSHQKLVKHQHSFHSNYFAALNYSKAITRRCLQVLDTIRDGRVVSNKTKSKLSGYMHSTLILGPSGSGKTEVLHYLQQYLINLQAPGVVLYISCKSTNSTFSMSNGLLADVLSRHTAIGSSNISAICNHILKLSQTVDVNVLNQAYGDSGDTINEPVRNKGIYIFLDDLDGVLLSPTAASNLSSLDDNTDEMKNCSIFLQDILAVVTNSVCDDNIHIFGATRLSEPDIDRRYIGPPGFEYVMELTCPTFEDRCSIVDYLWGKYVRNKYNLEGPTAHELNGTSSSIEEDWTNTIATLCGGYLPGDLCAVIKKMISICSIRVSSNGDSFENASPSLQWSDLLAAINCTLPKQLKNIDMSDEFSDESSANSNIEVNSGRGKKLTWDDFAGYNDQKKDLQNLMASLKITLSEDAETDSGDELQEDKTSPTLKIRHYAPRGCILWGPSGNGKSYVAKIIASQVCPRRIVYYYRKCVLGKYELYIC